MANSDKENQNKPQAPISEREIELLHFCEDYGNAIFRGNIEDRIAVRRFIKRFYEEAKQNYDALKAEYEAYQWERFWS